MQGERSTPRRASIRTSHPVERTLNRTFLEDARKARVELDSLGLGLGESSEAPPRQLNQPSGQIGPFAVAPRLAELGHDLATVRDEHDLARANQPQVLAEAILELPDTNGDHVRNVATSSPKA